jgi:hypothetical protein
MNNPEAELRGILLIKKNWLVNLYPNPAQDEFTLNYNFKTTGEVTFSIVNVIGELVYDEDVTNSKGKVVIDSKFLEPGVYFIKVNGNKVNETIRLVIAR